MRFEPVSTMEYELWAPDRQLLVCSLSSPKASAALREKWHDRAAAAFEFGPDDDVGDVVRDLLGNPQLRAIVFDGSGHGDKGLRSFWRREHQEEWGIATAHLELVRQFVDLFDGDSGQSGPLPPYWPERLRCPAPMKDAQVA
jgi:hypothetical protein